MSKQSPEQYLKYLAALSLAVTASAGAQSAAASEASVSSVEPKASTNLEALADVVAVENEAKPANYTPGCTSWPESTYVRRIQLRTDASVEAPALAAERSMNLEALVESVAVENEAKPANYMAGCTSWPESTYVRRIKLRTDASVEAPAQADGSLDALIDDVVGDMS